MSTDVERHFDLIEQDYLDSWCRFNPETALDAGVEAHAGLLIAHSDEAISIQIALNEKCLSALDEIDYEALSDQRRLHYRILYGHALLEHHSLMEHDWRYRDPTRFLPISALHQLTIRPLEHFSRSLLQRLNSIPNLLRAGRQYLSNTSSLIPPEWLHMALEETRAGIEFCQHLPVNPKVKQASRDTPQINQAIEQSRQALETFGHAIERIEPQCQGDFACGREHYERLLHHRHFLPINTQSLYRLGEKLLDESKAALDTALKQANCTVEQLQQSHPPPEALLQTYQQEMQAAHEFLQTHPLVSLPEKQQLKIIETPIFLRHQIPFAAYVEPSISDLNQTGYYYVTPVSDTESLKEHSFAAIAQTSLHEAWPGHHLQFSTANQSEIGSALLCRLMPCSSLYEGWALYCEQMMLEQGYNRYPHQDIIMLRDRVWRALRILIDIDIHTRGVTIEQAAQRLSSELGFSKQQALAEVRWYSQAPTVPMSYATGWALINALRDIVAPADQQALQDFHDKLLACGSIALPLVIEHQFGTKIWQQCCHHVFGGVL